METKKLSKLGREIATMRLIDDATMGRMLAAYEPTGAQLDEQRIIGFRDGSTGKPNRYALDNSRLGLAYQTAWRRGVDDAQDEINGTCIEG